MSEERIHALYSAVLEHFSEGVDLEDISRTVQKNFDAFLKIGIDPNQLLIMLDPHVAMEKIDTVEGVDVDLIAKHLAKTKSPALLRDYYRKFKERINKDTFDHCKEDWTNALRQKAETWSAESCLIRFKTLRCLPRHELAELIFEKCKYADASDCADVIESREIFDPLCRLAIKENRQSDFLRLIIVSRWENSRRFYEESLATGKILAERGFDKKEILRTIINQSTIDILSEDISELFKESGFSLDIIDQKELWNAMRENGDTGYFIREGELEKYAKAIGPDSFAKFLSFADFGDVDYWYSDKVRDHDNAEIEGIVENYILENAPDINDYYHYLIFTVLERLYHRNPEKAKAAVAKRRKEFNDLFDTIRTSNEYDDEEREFIKNFQ